MKQRERAGKVMRLPRFEAASRLLPAVLLGACVGCAHIPQQSESAKRAGFEGSNLELRTQTVSIGTEFLRQIEIAADSIEASTKDTRIQRNALEWKLSSVPAVEEAVLRGDLMIAVLDLSAFRQQLAAFLGSHAGHEAFGDQLPLAQHALDRLAPEWEAASASLGIHMTDEARAEIHAWVLEHPIERVPFVRATIVGQMAHTLRDQEGSLGAAVSGMQESLDRLEFRMSLTNEFAIKQASWLSQLGAFEVGATPEAADMVETMNSTRTLIDQTPEMIRRERVALLEDIERQRRESIATLQEERATVLAVLVEQRAMVLAAIDEQRRLAMRDVDSLRVRVIADEIRVVDHAILRVAELIGVLVLLAGAARLMTRRRLVPQGARAP